MVEWLDATSTLVLNLSTHKRLQRRGSPGKCRTLEDVALIVSPFDLAFDFPGDCGNKGGAKAINELSSSFASQKVGDTGVSISKSDFSDGIEIEPPVFPLTVSLLSTIPIALHAVGGDGGPLDIGARLYMSSYLR